MANRVAIESALEEWRAAERRQALAVGAAREVLDHEVERRRAAFQQISSDHIVEQIGMLQEAESRRRNATPSTPPFHQAARDTEEIASEIWASAHSNDVDTPQTEANRRHGPPSQAPGSK
jgi:hypothetical protein